MMAVGEWAGGRLFNLAAAGLRADDLPHGLVKGQTKHTDKEVDGVAGEIAPWPPPVTLFDDESGIGRQFEVGGRGQRHGLHFTP